MGHMLDTTDGITSYADSRTDAWHQLGQQVGHLMTAEEVLREAYMADWNVRKNALFTVDEEGNPIPILDRFATVRTNPVHGGVEQLGIVGPKYTVVQNEDTAAFLNALVDESGAHFETAGALYGGRQTFVTLRIPSYMEFTGTGGQKDDTDLYISALNSHDGTTAFQVIVTPVRIVCANTQTAALAQAKSRWSVRHTANALDAIAEARHSLEMTFRYADAFAEEMNKLIDRTVEEDEARRLIGEVFQLETAPTERTKTIRQDHVDAVLGGLLLDTQAGFEGTRYGLFNAVTEYFDHRVETRGGTQGASALSSVIYGNGLDMKGRAFQVLSA